MTSFPLDAAVCSTLSLSYDTGTAAIVAPLHVEASCTLESPEGTCAQIEANASGMLPGHWSQTWTDDSHPVGLVGPVTQIPGSSTHFVVAPDPATVLAPCTATFVLVTPDPVFNTNNANSSNTSNVDTGPLVESVRVTVDKGENCENLGLEYEHAPGSKGWKPFGASSEVILERNNQEAWSDGPRVLRLLDGQNGEDALAETELTIR